MSKNYLIVGGTSGIGRRVVDMVAEQDARVHIFSRSRHAASERPGTTQHVCDVTAEAPDFPDIDEPIAGLAYMPGSITLKPFHLLREKHFHDDLAVNLFGAVKTLQRYLKNLKDAEEASVVLMSTVAVQTGLPYHASIASAKGAVEGLTRSLAAELAPRDADAAEQAEFGDLLGDTHAHGGEDDEEPREQDDAREQHHDELQQAPGGAELLVLGLRGFDDEGFGLPFFGLAGDIAGIDDVTHLGGDVLDVPHGRIGDDDVHGLDLRVQFAELLNLAEVDPGHHGLVRAGAASVRITWWWVACWRNLRANIISNSSCSTCSNKNNCWGAA